MRRLILGLLLTLSACGGRTIFYRPRPSTADSVYNVALSFLDSTGRVEFDSAAKYLDLYVSMPRADRASEATIVRRLVRDAQQLARVEAALNQARAQTTETKTAEAKPAEAKAREDEALKEIQRLKDELAKANEELERIRKRLANPKPPDYD
jgi:hypothetical protein